MGNLAACHDCSFAVASRLAADQTMVPEPNLVVPDHLPLSKSVVQMATHAVKEACLGEFMAAVKVCAPIVSYPWYCRRGSFSFTVLLQSIVGVSCGRMQLLSTLLLWCRHTLNSSVSFQFIGMLQFLREHHYCREILHDGRSRAAHTLHTPLTMQQALF